MLVLEPGYFNFINPSIAALASEALRIVTNLSSLDAPRARLVILFAR